MLKNKLVLIIIAVLLLGGGGAYYFLLMGKPVEASTKKKAQVAHDNHEGHGEDEEHTAEESEEEEEEEEESGGHGGGHGAKGPVMEPFVVNLADTGSRRYLRLNLKLELKKREESEPLLEARMPKVRDAVLMLLSSKTTEQLGNAEGKATLRKELIAEISKALKKKKLKKAVKNVYFTEFLIQ